MNANTIGSRIKEQRAKLGISQLALAQRAGVTQGLIGQIEAGINKGTKHTVAIARALEVSPEWLDGVGKADDKRLATPLVSHNATGYLRVPLLDVEAGMGGERSSPDYPEVIRLIEISTVYLRTLLGFSPPEGRIVMITGRGDSMSPTIEPGEMVLIDTGTSYFKYDAIYALNLGNGLQIKRLIDTGTCIQVRSDNPLYPAFELPEGATIIGRVILRNRLERLG